MVTIATQAICDYIAEKAPVKPEYSFVEANLSGDKKASAQSFLTVRGKKVTVEVVVPAALVARRLHTTTEQMVNYWRMSALGSVMSGTIGVQGHYANGLAALFLACGQDVTCVALSSHSGVRAVLNNTQTAIFSAPADPAQLDCRHGGWRHGVAEPGCLPRHSRSSRSRQSARIRGGGGSAGVGRRDFDHWGFKRPAIHPGTPTSGSWQGKPCVKSFGAAGGFIKTNASIIAHGLLIPLAVQWLPR